VGRRTPSLLAATARGRAAHRVDLDGVSFIDARGRELGRCADRAVLVTADVMMRAVVDEIAGRAPRPDR
jgi:hypothetical protein